MRATRPSFLGIFLLAKLITGGPRAICPSPTIEAVEGEAVVLQCYLEPPHSVVKNAVDWKRVDLNQVVCSYRHGKENHDDQMSQYRGRATLDLKDLSGGNLSLRISSVQLNDSGPYRCFESRLRTSCSVNVSVAKNQQNETKSTTGPAEEDVTEPDDPDAAKMEAGWRTAVPIVPALIAAFVVVGVVVVVIFILVKRGKIQNCKKEQEPEGENGSEMRRLNTRAADGDEDPERPAADGSGSMVGEVERWPAD